MLCEKEVIVDFMSKEIFEQVRYVQKVSFTIWC